MLLRRLCFGIAFFGYHVQSLSNCYYVF